MVSPGSAAESCNRKGVIRTGRAVKLCLRVLVFGRGGIGGRGVSLGLDMAPRMFVLNDVIGIAGG